jgi:hydroxymethylbilane synthase
MRPLVIATRKSPLALWQARHVADLLRAASPGLDVTLLELTTEGDRFLGAPLSAVGGKGLFVKEIEQALLDRRADLAVHSLKDMTSAFPPGLCLGAVPKREDPRDAWVGRAPMRLLDLPNGSRIGTSSLRRSCQLLALRPDFQIVSVRGNVQTRLSKIPELDLAGVVLALAGLRRLGLEAHVTEALSPQVSLPAVGQGILAVQCRDDDTPLRTLLAQLEDADTRVATTAERAFLAQLEGGCNVPMAGHATLREGEVVLHGLVGSPDGKTIVRGMKKGPYAEAQDLGEALAAELLSQGAGDILKRHARAAEPRS